MNEINQSAEQKPATPTPEAEGGQGGERTFTQEEVNRIVQDRLTKERSKQGSPSEREAALTAREARLTCREYLLEAEAPSVYLDVLDTSDPERFRENVEKLMDTSVSRRTGMSISGSSPYRTGMTHQYGGEGSGDDAIADAFKPKRRR